MAPQVADAQIVCTDCGAGAKTRPTPAGAMRLPTGWKRTGEEVLCGNCKTARYRLRAVTFPVASVDQDDWREFSAAMLKCWARATELSNWAVRQLLMIDSERAAADTKLAPMPKADLYRRWTDSYHDRAAWDGATTSANSLLRAIEQKYRKSRYEVIWLNSERVPRMTFPVPYPVHNQSWKPSYIIATGEDGQTMSVPAVTVTLDGRKWVLKLRGGPERRRQLAAFAQIASGEAIAGELAIYRQRSYASHRRTATDREAGGGSKVKTRIMVKLVAHLPAPKIERRMEGTLEVRTGRKALLVATAPDRDTPWLYHADFLRRLIYEYDRRRQHVADDLKAEQRPASPALRERQRAMAAKMHRRLDSETRRIASMVSQYAVRQRLACVYYDDSDRRYFPHFDWGKLRRYLDEACQRDGLVFALASGKAANGDEGPEMDANP